MENKRSLEAVNEDLRCALRELSRLVSMKESEDPIKIWSEFISVSIPEQLKEFILLRIEEVLTEHAAQLKTELKTILNGD